MKSDFKAKFIQHMLRNKSNKGFTLIELLVVIIIIGILAAIALPSFLNQAAKAKQSEAKSYVGSVNRAQQAFRIEKPAFAANIADLEIGIPTTTVDYTYSIPVADAAKTQFDAVPTAASPLRAYAGGVVIIAATGQTSAAACQTLAPAVAAPPVTLNVATGAGCGANPASVMR